MVIRLASPSGGCSRGRAGTRWDLAQKFFPGLFRKPGS